MIDLTESHSAARCELARLAPKRSGDGDGLAVDLDLAFEVLTEGDAKAVAESVPGALALWRHGESAREAGRAEEPLGGASARSAASRGVYGGISIKVPDPDVRLSLRTLGGEEVVDALGEITSLRFKSTPKVSALVLKIRLLSVDAEEVGSLASLLGECVDARFERAQQALPFEEQSGPIAEIGSVVSGVQNRREYAGLVQGRAYDEIDGDLVEIDDFGEHLLVRSTSIAGAIRVRTNGRDLSDVVEEYRSLAEEAGISPSWRHLVVALGHEYLAGGETPEGWTLTTEIAESALEVAREVA